MITELPGPKALFFEWVADYYKDKYKDEEMNDYDKTDIDYKNLVEGNDCQPKNNWLTHPMLDPKVVAEGERFLSAKGVTGNVGEKAMVIKSTMPQGNKPIVAPPPDPYEKDRLKQKFLIACSKFFDEAMK